MQLFRTSKNPVRLEKKLTFDEKLSLKRAEVEKWALRNLFLILIALTALALITFVMVSLIFIGGTESGVYYNQLMNGNF